MRTALLVTLLVRVLLHKYTQFDDSNSNTLDIPLYNSTTVARTAYSAAHRPVRVQLTRPTAPAASRTRSLILHLQRASFEEKDAVSAHGRIWAAVALEPRDDGL